MSHYLGAHFKLKLWIKEVVVVSDVYLLSLRLLLDSTVVWCTLQGLHWIRPIKIHNLMLINGCLFGLCVHTAKNNVILYSK